MQIAGGGGYKSALRQFGGGLGRFSGQLPDHDVEFGRTGGERLKAWFGAEAAIELECGGTALLEAARELAAGDEGQKLLRGPQGDCGGAGARALQADLAQVLLL